MALAHVWRGVAPRIRYGTAAATVVEALSPENLLRRDTGVTTSAAEFSRAA